MNFQLAALITVFFIHPCGATSPARRQSGYPIITRCRFLQKPHTLGRSAFAPSVDPCFSITWGRQCFSEREDGSRTHPSSTLLTWTGDTVTQGWLYKLHADRRFHRWSWTSGSGQDCTFQLCSANSGRLGHHDPLICTPWIRETQRRRLWRVWRLRLGLRRRRRRSCRNRSPRKPPRAIRRTKSLWTAGIFTSCPNQVLQERLWRCLAHCTDSLLRLLVQTSVFKQAQAAARSLDLGPDSRTGPSMSGSDEDRATPAVPKGPPIPLPVTALQRWSHLISNAVASTLEANLIQGFEGRVLTHMPFTFGDIRNLSITLGGFTAEDHDHPNVLEYRSDSPRRDMIGITQNPGIPTASTIVSSNAKASGAAPTSGPTTMPRTMPPKLPKAKAKASTTPSRKSEPYLSALQATQTHWVLLTEMCHSCLGGRSTIERVIDSRCYKTVLKALTSVLSSESKSEAQQQHQSHPEPQPGRLLQKVRCQHQTAMRSLSLPLLLIGSCIYVLLSLTITWMARYSFCTTSSTRRVASDTDLITEASRCCHTVCRSYIRKIHFITGLYLQAGPEQSHQLAPASRRTQTGRQDDNKKASRAGPKSGRASGRHLRRALFIICSYALLSIAETGSTDARVEANPTVPSGVASATKSSGARKASEPTHVQPSRCVKRSFNRAYTQACKHGGSYYKGRWHETSWFRGAQLRPQFLRPHRPVTPNHHVHWRVFSWNSGGLTTSVYQELESYAKTLQADIMMIQESKWHFEATWSTREYHYIHTPGTGQHDRLAGLLVMVSTRLVKADQLQFRVHHAGRLIHVRIPYRSIHVDVVNWYQYAVNDKESTPDRRQKLLVKVQRCLAHLPKRNALIFGGDFNCPCEPHKNTCGQVTVPFDDKHYMDLQDHQHVWRTLFLTALNTWQQPSHGQVATFAMGESETAAQSQIDFIMIKAQHVTLSAKQASIIADYPVAAWRGGPRHYPVLAMVPIPKPPWNHKVQVQASPVHIDREQLIGDSRMAYPPPRLENLRAEISANLHLSVDSYNTVLMQAAQKHYPLKKTDMQAPTQSEELANCAKRMWSIFRQMRSHRFTLPGVLTAWKQWTQFQQAHRIHKERSRQRSKQRKIDLLQQAQQAAAQGNVHELWKTIRRLAPKAPRKRLQLHKDGHMISPEAELDWILEAYGDRYAVDDHQAPISFTFPQHQGLALDSKVLHFYLQRLNPRKAVPHGTAPAVVWRVCADLLALPVTQAFNDPPDGKLMILQRWSDADVALLPKAHGRSESPLDWRPIGVQDPLGKCLMSTVVAQARQAIHDLIVQYPQCAYVRNRSTHTALRQVFSHCKLIRDQCAQARLTLHDQHAGQVRTKCSGGLQISLDLSAAFDLVEWTNIKQALDLAQVNIAVQEIILTWLTQVRYLFRHRQLRGTIKPRRGLRQGCTASPVLWAAFTSLLCASIEAQLTPQWTRDHLCLYADDSHLRFRFESFEEFTSIMNDIRIVFMCFRNFHLQINTTKTQAILKVVGTLKHRVHKEYVRKHQASKRLLLSPRDPDRWLSLVHQAEYLGMIISYDNYEQQCLKHRLTKAHNRRWALASVLHSRRLGVQYKLNIWRSCVYSTMLYGLAHCGLSGEQAGELQKAIMKHTRAIVSNQAFLTGETHESIILRYGIPRIQEDLLRDLQRADRIQARTPHWMYHNQWQQHLYHRLSLRAPAEECPETHLWACPMCDNMYPTQAALKTHARRAHQHVDTHRFVFSRAAHSVNGLPTCKFCSKNFSRWQTLSQHISQNRCTKFREYLHDLDKDEEKAEAAPEIQQTKPTAAHTESPDTTIVRQQEDVIKAARQGLKFFIPLNVIKSRLQHTCAQCGQWIASHRTVKRHYQYTHPELLQQLGSTITSYINRAATACPTCHYCNARCKDWKQHMHRCTVIWQCAIMCLQEQPGRLAWTGGAGRVLRRPEEADDGTELGAPTQQASTTSSRTIQGRHASTPQLSRFFGKASDQARGRDQAAEAGSLIDLFPSSRRKQHDQPPLPDRQKLQGKAGSQPTVGSGSATSQSDHGNRHVQGTGSTPRSPVPGPDTTCSGQGIRVAGPGHRMEVSTVEPSVESLGGGQQQIPHQRSDGGEPLAEALPGLSPRHCTQVPLHSEDGRCHGVPSNLPTGPFHQDGHIVGSMGCINGSTGMHGSATGGVCIQAGDPQAQPGHREAQRHDLRALRLTLCNTSNSCYMNSTVQVIQWMLDLDAHRIDSMGTGRAFFRALQLSSLQHPKTLMQDMLWRMMVSQWADCHRQHDIAEFISHLAQRHNFAIVQGKWQARRLFEGEFQIRDEGTCSQPILLHMPTAPPGLDVTLQVQSLIDFWSGAQANIHALLHAPDVLMLQLDRFRSDTGRVFKRQDAVDVNREIMMPFFADHQLYIELAHYRLLATITHHGAHPRTGHYTACLHAEGSLWSCDDNRSAVSVQDFSASHAQGCYLLFYEKIS